MIEIKCTTPDRLPYNKLLSFQGELKKRSEEDISGLCKSLLADGLLMPFVIWKHDNLNFLLDGHGRYTAIQRLAVNDPAMLAADFPVIYVEAATLDDAKLALLQINSHYGAITNKGLKKFLGDVPTINTDNLHIGVKIGAAPKIKAGVERLSKYKIIRVKVDTEHAQDVLHILSSCSYVEVL